MALRTESASAIRLLPQIPSTTIIEASRKPSTLHEGFVRRSDVILTRFRNSAVYEVSAG